MSYLFTIITYSTSHISPLPSSLTTLLSLSIYLSLSLLLRLFPPPPLDAACPTLYIAWIGAVLASAPPPDKIHDRMSCNELCDHVLEFWRCSSHGTMPNTYSRVSLIPVREDLVINFRWRKLPELVLYPHQDIDKIVNTRERSIAIRRIIKVHLPSVVRR